MRIYLLTRSRRPLGDSLISWHSSRKEAEGALEKERVEIMSIGTGRKQKITSRAMPKDRAGLVKLLNSVRHLSLP